MYIKNDQTPVSLTSDEKSAAIKTLDDMWQVLSYAKMLFSSQSHQIVRQDVATILGLSRSYHADLAKLLHYEDVLALEEEQKYKEIREANLRVRALQEELGGKQTAESIEAGLTAVQDAFYAWYEQQGFQYVEMTFTQYGITAEISEQLSANKYEWDVSQTGNLCLLDTDKNRAKMEELLKTHFPNCRITGFSSMVDNYDKKAETYELRTNAFISFSDLVGLERN